MVIKYPLIASIMLATGFVILLVSLYSATYKNQPKSNIFCGGIANISCPAGYTCRLDGQYPDAGGQCVKNIINFDKPDVYSCNQDSDCGIYSCGCIGQNINAIPKGMGCAQECPGTVSCVNQKCYFEYRESPPAIKYSCPASEWVNCMPVVGGPQNEQCNQDFLTWAQKNCPNFKGAAY